jgi:hypothetical protein
MFILSSCSSHYTQALEAFLKEREESGQPINLPESFEHCGVVLIIVMMLSLIITIIIVVMLSVITTIIVMLSMFITIIVMLPCLL